VKKGAESLQEFAKRMKPLCADSRWLLRITEHTDRPSPVLVIKERVPRRGETDRSDQMAQKTELKDRGILYGKSLRACLPAVREIIRRICDPSGIPLELHRILNNGNIDFRGNLPLDEEAGAKLALMFKLQERISDMARVELISWRVQRFSREEAVYWLTRLTQYSEPLNRWAQAGMRLMLAGQAGDKAVNAVLDSLRKQ